MANRARLCRDVAKAVRDAAGDSVAVYAKLNMADGVPGGLWLDQSVEIGRLLAEDGALDALELTGGSSFENPMYLFRGDAPIREMSQGLAPWMRAGMKLVGRRFLVEYPFEEAFFLPYARQFLREVPLPIVLLGGITRIETIRSALEEGFAFVAMARALLREPDLVVENAGRGVARVPVRPLQQVHAHDLHGHALRLGRADCPSRAPARRQLSARPRHFDGTWMAAIMPPSITNSAPVQ